MSKIIAFDVYGTLIDTAGVKAVLQKVIGDKAEAFSQTWRSKQLEYAFRRGLMQRYEDFAVCTRNALDYCCLLHQENLSDVQKQALLDSYSQLPAFNDVAVGLSRLKAEDHQLFAFSNGSKQAVEALLFNAGIRSFFKDIVSTDGVKSFKPNPEVYRYFLRSVGASERNAWLVSSNSFDVIGAVSAGMNAAWLKRNTTDIFDPWDFEPTITIASMAELASKDLS
ncbi:MAG: haloacid dehalogenase type II [Methylophaga sp.]